MTPRTSRRQSSAGMSPNDLHSGDGARTEERKQPRYRTARDTAAAPDVAPRDAAAPHVARRHSVPALHRGIESRMEPKPGRNATSVIGSTSVSQRRRSGCAATARSRVATRRGALRKAAHVPAVTPRRCWASASESRRRARLRPIRRSARETVVDVPFQAEVHGATSGRHRRHANPAASAARAPIQATFFFTGASRDRSAGVDARRGTA